MTTDNHARSSGASWSEDVYLRDEEVGSGGIGTVYKGTQARLDRPVAIKEIRNIFHVFADVQREDIVGRFSEIVQTQALLDHPNIIQIYDVITDSDYPYVVTQWAPRGNLRRLIDKEGRPPLNVAMSYFMQVLHALNAAHEEGVVHGGLKPENVVLDPAGNALLTDFGMTKVVERASGGASSQVYVGVGTVAYMSPEQFRDPNLVSIQSDIYSLGIMFYEMLTGKVPGRRSPMPSSFYPDIPRKLDDIFDKMSMDDRDDRYDTVREVLREVYASPDVLKIMDQRAGVLFLRDPLKHGELGMGDDVADLPEAPGAVVGYGDLTAYDGGYDEGSFEQVAPAPEEHAEPIEAYSDDEGDDGYEGEAEGEEGASWDGEAEAGEDAAATDDELEVAAADASEGGDDVLNKLDKYGALFDDDEEG